VIGGVGGGAWRGWLRGGGGDRVSVRWGGGGRGRGGGWGEGGRVSKVGLCGVGLAKAIPFARSRIMHVGSYSTTEGPKRTREKFSGGLHKGTSTKTATGGGNKKPNQHGGNQKNLKQGLSTSSYKKLISQIAQIRKNAKRVLRENFHRKWTRRKKVRKKKAVKPGKKHSIFEKDQKGINRDRLVHICG